MPDFKGWFRENQALVFFLIAQAIAIGAAVLTMTAYVTKLEQRVVTLETRGSPHLGIIDIRLTALEAKTQANQERIDRLVDMATRK